MQTRRIPRRLFWALLAVILWMGFLVDGSHALYADQVTLTGNSITSGTTDLLISNSQNASSTVFDKSRTGFAFNLSPGEQADRYFLVKNASDGDVDFRLSVAAAVSGTDYMSLIEHTQLVFKEIAPDGSETGNSTQVTLTALRNGPVETPFVITKGSTQRYKMSTSLTPDYGTQGQAATYDLIFIGNQVISG